MDAPPAAPRRGHWELGRRACPARPRRRRLPLSAEPRTVRRGPPRAAPGSESGRGASIRGATAEPVRLSSAVSALPARRGLRG